MSGVADTAVRIPARLSPTAIQRFRTCPRQFFYCDIERVARQKERSPVLAQANAIHEALQLFYGLRLEYRLADNLERCLRACWRKHSDGAFTSRGQEAASGLAAIEMLRNYAASFEITIEPIAREKWVSLRLEEQDLYGKVDRIDRRGTGLSLVDYKTGRRVLDLGDLRQEPAVQIYVLGAEASLRLPVAQVRLIYLATGEEVSWDLEREDVEALAASLRRTLGELQEERVFAASAGQHCHYCPVQLDCPDKDRVEIERVAESAAVASAELPF